MVQVKKKTLSWDPPADIDVVGHKLYVVPEGSQIDPASTPYITIGMPTTTVLLPDDFPEDTFDQDINYTIGIAAIDDVGNEGDIVTVQNPFDFIAPGIVTNIRVEDA